MKETLKWFSEYIVLSRRGDGPTVICTAHRSRTLLQSSSLREIRLVRTEVVPLLNEKANRSKGQRKLELC